MNIHRAINKSVLGKNNVCWKGFFFLSHLLSITFGSKSLTTILRPKSFGYKCLNRCLLYSVQVYKMERGSEHDVLTPLWIKEKWIVGNHCYGDLFVLDGTGRIKSLSLLSESPVFAHLWRLWTAVSMMHIWFWMKHFEAWVHVWPPDAGSAPSCLVFTGLYRCRSNATSDTSGAFVNSLPPTSFLHSSSLPQVSRLEITQTGNMG